MHKSKFRLFMENYNNVKGSLTIAFFKHHVSEGNNCDNPNLPIGNDLLIDLSNKGIWPFTAWYTSPKGSSGKQILTDLRNFHVTGLFADEIKFCKLIETGTRLLLQIEAKIVKQSQYLARVHITDNIFGLHIPTSHASECAEEISREIDNLYAQISAAHTEAEVIFNKYNPQGE